MKHILKGARAYVALIAALMAIVIILFFSIPAFVIWEANHPAKNDAFPVTVHPKEKTITEDPAVNLQLSVKNSSLAGAVSLAGDVLNYIASAISQTPWYEALAAADTRIVIIDPGYRKEQAALAFGKALSWDKSQQKSFLTTTESWPPKLTEGQYAPGAYVVASGMPVAEVQKAIYDRFTNAIASRYTPATEKEVPLSEALTIASMIERETNDKEEMRIISGIMWNRIFNGMKLQIDATLQYAKADGTHGWWPQLRSADKYIDSPYNTYLNVGLPPAPISNPSVAAVLATLNPKNTDCLFYFHDRNGDFHCTNTYEEHVKLLKKYYGQGK